MFSERLLTIIEDSGIGRWVAHKREVVESTDPDRIYIENVRSFFGLPTRIAALLCRLAVRDGVFMQRAGVLCPNDGRIIASYNTLHEIPEQITCQVCELSGEFPYEWTRDEVATIIYYVLVRETEA